MEKKKYKKMPARNRWLIGIACTVIFILGFVTVYEKYDEIINFFQKKEIIDDNEETRPNKYNDMEIYYDDDKKSDDYFVGNYIEYFYVDYPVTCEKFRKNEIVYQITINKDHTAKIYTGSCMGEKETDLLWKNNDGIDLYYKDNSLFAELGHVPGEGKITHLLINNIEFARTSTKYMKNEEIIIANDISIHDIYSWNDYGGYVSINLEGNFLYEFNNNLKQKVKEYNNLYFYINDNEENYLELNGKKIYSLDYGLAEKFDVLDNYFVVLEMGYANDIGPDIGIGGYNIELFNNEGIKTYSLYDVLLEKKLIKKDFARITFKETENILKNKKIIFEIATEDYIDYILEKESINPNLSQFETKKMYDSYEIEYIDGTFSDPKLINTTYYENLTVE